MDRESTVEFYSTSFAATEILNVKILGARMEAGRLLETGVLADMRGQDSYALLDRALTKLKESRALMDELYEQIGRMRAIAKKSVALPEHDLL